jgi:hypothetical protein
LILLAGTMVNIRLAEVQILPRRLQTAPIGGYIATSGISKLAVTLLHHPERNFHERLAELVRHRGIARLPVEEKFQDVGLDDFFDRVHGGRGAVERL